MINNSIDSIITKNQLTDVLSDYYKRDIVVTDWNVQDFNKNKINSSLIIIDNVNYLYNFKDISPPKKIVVKKYNEDVHSITGRRKIGKNKIRHGVEKRVNRFVAKEGICTFDDLNISFPVAVTCYNTSKISDFDHSLSLDELEKNKILVYEYGGESHEVKLTKLQKEGNTNNEDKIKDLLRSGLKTSAFLHTKMYDYAIDISGNIAFKGITKSDKNYYNERLNRYLKTIFDDKNDEHFTSFKKRLTGPLDILADYMEEKPNRKHQIEKFITIIHGDTTPGNFLESGNGYTQLCDWERTRRASSTFDISKYLINDLIPLNLSQVESLIVDDYLPNTQNFLDKIKNEKRVLKKNFSFEYNITQPELFVGTVFISSLFTLLKDAAYKEGIRKSFSSHHEKILENDPDDLVNSDIEYDLNKIQEVTARLIQNDYSIPSKVIHAVDDFKNVFDELLMYKKS